MKPTTLLDTLGRRLAEKAIAPGEALGAVLDAKLDVIDIDTDNFHHLDEGARRSIRKWASGHAGLDLSEVRRVVFTRRWALVEFMPSPGVSSTRFVKAQAPGPIVAMMDRGERGVTCPGDGAGMVEGDEVRTDHEECTYCGGSGVLL